MTAKSDKIKKKGRPTVFTMSALRAVKKLASYGLAVRQIANFLEVSESACEKNENFQRVYKKSLAKVGVKVRSALLAKIYTDTASAIYLDKILNKALTGKEEEDLKIKKEELKIKQQDLKLKQINLDDNKNIRPVNLILSKDYKLQDEDY